MTIHPLVEALALERHPEGGWFRRIYASETVDGTGRPTMTSILYLLSRGERSRWHVVDADEAWHFNEGSPLLLHVYDPQSRQLKVVTLGPASRGHESTWVVSAGCWQAATVSGDWGLVGCTVAPGFEYSGFRLIADLAGHEEHFQGALGDLRGLL